MFFGFAWAWLAIAGRKAIPWLFISFRDFELPEHVPQISVRAHTCAQFSRGPPACPVTERKRKDPRAEEQKMPTSKKIHIVHSNTRLPFGEWGVPRGATQAGMPEGGMIACVAQRGAPHS